MRDPKTKNDQPDLDEVNETVRFANAAAEQRERDWQRKVERTIRWWNRHFTAYDLGLRVIHNRIPRRSQTTCNGAFSPPVLVIDNEAGVP